MTSIISWIVVSASKLSQSASITSLAPDIRANHCRMRLSRNAWTTCDHSARRGHIAQRAPTAGSRELHQFCGQGALHRDEPGWLLNWPLDAVHRQLPRIAGVAEEVENQRRESRSSIDGARNNSRLQRAQGHRTGGGWGAGVAIEQFC